MSTHRVLESAEKHAMRVFVCNWRTSEEETGRAIESVREVLPEDAVRQPHMRTVTHTDRRRKVPRPRGAGNSR